MKNKLLIFGYGYVAKALSENLVNYEILATSRQGKTSNKIKIIDFEFEAIKSNINSVTHIISTIPPDRLFGDPVLQKFTQLIQDTSSLKYICYLSATSVYGNHNGDWVDEDSHLQIENERANIRYQSELDWKSLAKTLNIPLVIMRIAGIYGPRRSVLDKIQDGSVQYVLKKDHLFSRIHIDDIVNALILSLSKDKASNIYNLSDDMPAPQHEVVEYAANLLNAQLPMLINFEDADLSEMMREFYMSSKKVSNKKIKAKLGLKLNYPSYKEGLRSILKEMKNAQ